MVYCGCVRALTQSKLTLLVPWENYLVFNPLVFVQTLVEGL